MLKDNKIDIMCQKIGMMLTECTLIKSYSKDQGALEGLDLLRKSLGVLLTDLELLRKCTLDNPDFKWEDQ